MVKIHNMCVTGLYVWWALSEDSYYSQNIVVVRIKYNRNIVVLLGSLLYLHTNLDNMLLQNNTTMNIYLRMYKWLEQNINGSLSMLEGEV